MSVRLRMPSKIMVTRRKTRRIQQIAVTQCGEAGCSGLLPRISQSESMPEELGVDSIGWRTKCGRVPDCNLRGSFPRANRIQQLWSYRWLGIVLDSDRVRLAHLDAERLIPRDKRCSINGIGPVVVEASEVILMSRRLNTARNRDTPAPYASLHLCFPLCSPPTRRRLSCERSDRI